MGYHLFKILASLLALKDTENIEITPELFVELYRILKMPDLHTLWNSFLGRLLTHIKTDPLAWTVVTPQRCIFEIILLESREAFGEYLGPIGDILVATLDPAADPESRLKTFWALSTAFENKTVIFEKAKDLGGFFNRLILGMCECVS